MCQLFDRVPKVDPRAVIVEQTIEDSTFEARERRVATAPGAWQVDGQVQRDAAILRSKSRARHSLSRTWRSPPWVSPPLWR